VPEKGAQKERHNFMRHRYVPGKDAQEQPCRFVPYKDVPEHAALLRPAAPF
jgi:hypothetical protein